ncbi:hypothetical protein BDR26DRAFT_303734 [Obelidium mucronatum]|nr:hypothetical protein BDR26DRAFT_303734 [Obelidium mucronatum]
MLMDLQGGITWSYVSEHGTDDEVLDWLKSEENAVSGEIILDIIERLEKNAGLWLKVVDLLRLRGCYCREAWALSVKHGSEEHLIQWLFSEKARDLSYLKAGDRERDDFVEGNQDIYSYWPLINARAHEIGQKSRANNREFIETYSKFLLYLLVKPVARHTCRDHISLICYLLLQDRFSEALVRFNHLKEEIASNRVQLDMEIQMDYLAAWFDFIDQSALVGSASLQTARSVGIKYKDYPVKHWNELFASILARVNEFDEFYSEATSNDGTSTGPQATKV